MTPCYYDNCPNEGIVTVMVPAGKIMWSTILCADHNTQYIMALLGMSVN